MSGVGVSVGARLDDVRHTFSHFRVVLHPFECVALSSTKASSAARWASLAELDALAMTSTARRIASTLAGAR